jgi:WD40 repeat protein
MITVPTTVARQDLVIAYLEAAEGGLSAELAALRDQHPGLAEEVAEYLAFVGRVDEALHPLRPAGAEREPLLPAGTRINDYEILEFLAHGGMGVVYRAHQHSLKRDVALKMLRGSARASADDIRRLREEAEHAAALEHANIVPIYEVGDFQGLPYFSMGLVRGGSLARLPPRLADDPRRVARLLVLIARTVHHAHQRGVLHRDLKPANILLAQASEDRAAKALAPAPIPMVTDFGLAQLIGVASESLAGTPSYMAPEQAAGEKRLTVAVDVYGLGAILYELLTGRPPILGTTISDTLHRIRTEPPRPPHEFWPKVPRDLEAICLKCLEKDPARRYDSAADLARDLERFLDHRPVRARRRSLLSAAGLWIRRQPVLAALLATLLVLPPLGIAYLVERAKTASKERDRKQILYVHSIGLANSYRVTGQLSSAEEALKLCPPELRRWEWHFLHRACQRHVVVLVGHEGQVLRVEYSPDGTRLATAGEDGWVKVWDPRTGGEPLFSLPVPRGKTGVCFSSDGRTLLISDAGRQVWCCDARTGRGKKDLGPGEQVVAARDKPVVAWVGINQALTVWNLSSGQPVCRLDPPRADKPVLLDPPRADERVLDLALSPDGKYLAVSGYDSLLQVYNLPSGQPKLLLEVDNVPKWENAWAVAFSPDSKSLAVGGRWPVVWDLEPGRTQRIVAAQGLALPSAGAPAFPQVVVASKVASLDVPAPELESGKALRSYYGSDLKYCSSLSFSTDGTRLAAVYRDGFTRVWDTQTGQMVLHPRKHKLQVTSAAFSPEPGSHHLAWARGREVVIEDLKPPPQRPEQILRDHEDKTLWALAFSPDGKLVASRSATEVCLWSLPEGKLRWRSPARVAVAHEATLVFSPEGGLVVSGGKGDLQVYETDSGQKGPPLPAARDTRVLAFGRGSGQANWLLATSDGSGRVMVWDQQGGLQRTLEDAEVGEVRGLAFDATGQRLAVCGSLGIVKLWSLTATRPRAERVFRGHTQSVWCVVFSPDGKQLATGSADETVRLWDTESGQEVFTWPGHAGHVAGVSFSPDGRSVASCSNDGLIKLWDPQTGQEVLTLTGHERPVTAVAFSPDGQLLASCGHDGMVRVWDGRKSP